MALSYDGKRKKRLKIGTADLPFIGLCLLAGGYLIAVHPLMIAVLGCAALVLLGLYHVSQAIPIVEKYVGSKIKFWHVVSVIITITALLSTFETPSYAIFLQGLEDFVAEIATASNSGVDAATITLIFNLIRGVFLLLVAAAALFAYNQAQQGNDWRPIVGQAAMAFGIVIAIDVVTFLFVGQ